MREDLEALNPRFEKLFKILIVVSVIVRFLLTFNRAFNADEFQHLHNAWMIHLGFLPYRDFWDNHTPLLHYLLAPILGTIGPGELAIYTARALLSCSAFAILYIVYKIAEMLLGHRSALIAVLLLSLSDIFLQKTIEVRPDQMLVLFWMTSLWMCLRPRAQFFAGGISLGIGALFSTKALICLAAASIVFFFFSKKSFGQRIQDQLLYLSGLMIPLLVLAFYFFNIGHLSDLVNGTLIQNFTYPDIHSSVFLIYPQNIFFFLLSFSGMFLWLIQSKTIHHPVSLFLLIGVIVFFLVAFVMPGTYAQAGLMFVPIFSIFSAFAVKASLNSPRLIFRILTLTAAILVPAVSIFLARPFERTNATQIARMKWILDNTRPTETIFDGNSVYIFRKQAYYYGSLVAGVRHQIEHGVISHSIPASLTRNRCRMLIYDDRVSDLPFEVQEFLRANYIDTGQYEIFLAAKKISAESFSGNRATFHIEIPAVYDIQTNAKQFQIDGARYTGPLQLNSGTHEIRADVELRSVFLLAK